MILEDVATAPIGEGTEADRMTVLAEIDALPVSYRAELGTHVLWMLDHVSDSPPGETKWAFRRFRSDRGLQHLMFGACSRYDRIIHQRFEEWVVLRHVEFANDLGTPEELTSVGILLTPRHDDVRPWDTTMIRASGEFDLTPQELAEMRMLWTDEPG
jgi:hypothetical protein